MKHLKKFNESESYKDKMKKKVADRKKSIEKESKKNLDWDKFFEDISDDEYFKKFKFTELDDMCSIIRKYIEKQLK